MQNILMPCLLWQSRHCIGLAKPLASLQHLTPIKMLQRQPGLARRSALLQQLWATTLRLPVVARAIISIHMSTTAMFLVGISQAFCT